MTSMYESSKNGSWDALSSNIEDGNAAQQPQTHGDGRIAAGTTSRGKVSLILHLNWDVAFYILCCENNKISM